MEAPHPVAVDAVAQRPVDSEQGEAPADELRRPRARAAVGEDVALGLEQGLEVLQGARPRGAVPVTGDEDQVQTSGGVRRHSSSVEGARDP